MASSGYAIRSAPTCGQHGVQDEDPVIRIELSGHLVEVPARLHASRWGCEAELRLGASTEKGQTGVRVWRSALFKGQPSWGASDKLHQTICLNQLRPKKVG